MRRLSPLFFLLLLFACGQERGPSAPARTEGGAVQNEQEKLPRGRVILSPEGRPERSVKVEIAATTDSRRQGLMYRQKLAEDEGMLFLFPASEQLGFWMKNTYLPLDMIFIKQDLTVLGVVEGAEPLTETTREVPGESQYVLEVNATYAKKHGIGPGTKVRFEGTEGIEVK
jgi:uncharacterized protein